MLLFDIDDIENLFANKVSCYGAVFAGTSAALTGGAAVAANVALVAGIAGTVMSVGGQIQQGKQAANQATFQAQVAQNDAIIAAQQRDRAIKTAASNEEDFRRQQSAVFGSRRALLGDTGVISGAGSPLAVSTDFQGEVELNALRLRNEGDVQANRLQQSVLNAQSQAGLFGAQARSARASSFTRAGGELFSGIQKTARGFRSTVPSASSSSQRNPYTSIWGGTSRS